MELQKSYVFDWVTIELQGTKNKKTLTLKASVFNKSTK